MKRPLIAVALAASFAVSPALAGSTDAENLQVEVKIDRSALDDASKISAEYDNIREQVEARCEDAHGTYRIILNYTAVKGCVNQMMDRTVQQINHADLTDLHKEKRFG